MSAAVAPVHPGPARRAADREELREHHLGVVTGSGVGGAVVREVVVEVQSHDDLIVAIELPLFSRHVIVRALDVEEAIATAERELERLRGVPCAVVRLHHIETRSHFYFVWNSRRAVESSGREGVIAGNGPVAVEKNTGTVHPLERVDGGILGGAPPPLPRPAGVDPSTADGARLIAQIYLDARHAHARAIDRPLEERDRFWVFGWNDERALAGDQRYALLGNSPLVVDKESGAIELLSLAEGLNVQVDALEDRRLGYERVDTISIRDQTDRAGWSLQLRVRGGPVGRPATRIEVPSRRRIRVVVGNQPALWAEIDDDHYGYRWMRAERVRSVIPSLRVEDIRAHGDAQSSGWLARWSRTFVRMLSESDASPLYPGAWDLRALTTAFDGYFARDARAMLEQSARDAEDGYTEWDFGDRPPPLLLRVPSAADHGRVKAWRKIARGGQLPPLLLWWVSGLDRHLVLDGADRLVAATLEGVTPAALSLSGVRSVPTSRTKDRELAEWAEQSGRFTNEQLNALAMKGFDDPVRRESITRAWPATDAAWPIEL